MTTLANVVSETNLRIKPLEQLDFDLSVSLNPI